MKPIIHVESEITCINILEHSVRKKKLKFRTPINVSLIHSIRFPAPENKKKHYKNPFKITGAWS